MAGDDILNYYDLCISITIAFLTFMINPFTMSAMDIHYASATLTCIDYSNNTTIASMRNCELLNSHFHRVDLFSELSRNMTPSSSSSSDLFEDAENTGKEDAESSAEADDLQDKTTTGQANESLSSSPSSPSNLFEDTNETEEGQDNAESSADDNMQEQDITTSAKSSEDNDNTLDSQLTNST